MKTLKCLISLALLGVGLAFSGVQAAGPDYQDFYANPERMVPIQPAWQLQPVQGNELPWEKIFTFNVGIAPDLMERVRWLSLNPHPHSELSPALLDVMDGRILSLSPAARSFCDGRWQVVWLETIGINTAYQPLHKVWLRETTPSGRRRSDVGYGRLDAQGHWAVPPKHCDGASTVGAESSPALSYLPQSDAGKVASDLSVAMWKAQPGLRDRQGKWLTPLPQKDVTAAQWIAYRQHLITPGSTGAGLIDVRGNMVVPFVFNDLPDASRQRRIRLCTGLAREHHAAARAMCRWQRLKGGDGQRAPQLAQDVGTGKWGYQDRQGQWVIAPQFRQARPFKNGYAVVSGLFPQAWRPPWWQEDWPILRKFFRVGQYWVAEAVVRNASTDGQWVIRYGLINDAGQWLVPLREAPLQVTVLFPPGGRSSHYAQMLAAHLPNLLGREVQVEHMPKATEADYQRLVMQGGNNKVLLAALRLPRGGLEGVHQGPPIDALLRSLRPVTLLASEPMILVIDSARAEELAIHSMDTLIAYARAYPGRLRIGTGAKGWTSHLALGYLQALTGLEVQGVSYQGMYPNSNVITKDHAVDLLFAPVAGVVVAVRRGQLRVLGTTATGTQWFQGQEWPALASSAALAGYAVYDHFSLWAPQNSGDAFRRRLQDAVGQVLRKPEIQKHLQGMQVVGGGESPERLLMREEEERAIWERVRSTSTSAHGS